MFSLYTVHADVTINSVTTDLPPVVNRTDSDCFYSCSFNNRSSSGYIRIEVGALQPCVYMVEVTRVFKGNNTVSIILTVELYSGSSPCHQCHRLFGTPGNTALVTPIPFFLENMESLQEIWNPLPSQEISHPGC